MSGISLPPQATLSRVDTSFSQNAGFGTKTIDTKINVPDIKNINLNSTKQ